MEIDDPISPPPPRTRTITSLVMLLVAATIFSYLACFAIPHALVTADVLPAWPAGDDPRPRWMIRTFCALMGSFLLIFGWFRFLSWRQFRGIAAMEREEG